MGDQEVKIQGAVTQERSNADQARVEPVQSRTGVGEDRGLLLPTQTESDNRTRAHYGEVENRGINSGGTANVADIDNYTKSKRNPTMVDQIRLPLDETSYGRASTQ